MPPRRQVAFSSRSRARILDEVIRDHHRLLLQRARLHSADPADAEDALNEASLSFLRNYNGPPGQDALNWLKAVTKYTAWSFSRRASDRRRNQRPEAYVASRSLRGRAEPQKGREELAELLSHLCELKPDERAALLLLGFGFSHREIAELRSWSARKTNRCIFEGRRRLREVARQGDEEEGGSIP
jgi:DNA-directed RNA polymerase specialized sigma24 family protein